jgi:hypothetical protein
MTWRYFAGEEDGALKSVHRPDPGERATIA